jgi:IS1 family transposase
VLVGLPCTNVQCDEIWSYCYSKQKNVPEQHKGTFGYGDVWTWTALCADTKLVPSWLVADHTIDSAWAFLADLKGRLDNRVQLTTDGYRVYWTAVGLTFGREIDYAQLQKMYGPSPNEGRSTRYSPAWLTGTDIKIIRGNPDPAKISTSYVERQNLTMRMGMRRYTRLTNGFSKKVENLAHAVALHYMHYNFARVHQTLKTTPAIAAGVTDHRWTPLDIAALLDD